MSDLASAVVFLEVYKYQVVFVDQVFDVEIESCKHWDDWDDAAEQEAVQEDDQAVTLVVAQIELVIIVERLQIWLILAASLVHLLLEPPYNSVWCVYQRQSICNKGQLDDELDIEVLLGHHIAAQHRRPLPDILALQLLKEQ